MQLEIKEINKDLKKFLQDMQKKYQHIGVDYLTNYINRFNLEGKELTKSIKTYMEKIISHFNSRMPENGGEPIFKILVNVLEAFLKEALKIDKKDYPGSLYGKKLFVLCRSLIRPKKNLTAPRGQGRKRLIEVDEKTVKAVRRKEKRKVEKKELSLSEKWAKQMFN